MPRRCAIANRASSWFKQASIAAAAITGLAVVLMRALDLRKLLVSQLAVPHGPLGALVARAMPMAHSMFYAPAAERLRLQAHDELLEVACGAGMFLDRHAGHVGRIAGLDLSDIQVKLARRRLRERVEKGTAEIVQGDAGTLPWGDETFTAVLCVGSLDLFVDPDAAVAEMHRVLRPGGRLVVTYGADEHDEALGKDAVRWGFPAPTEAEARKLVESAGFALTSVSYLEGDYPARYLEAVKPE